LHHALAEQVRPEFLGGVFKLWDAFQVFGATNNAVTMFSGSVVVVAKFFDAVAGISGTNNAASIRLMPNSSLQLQKTPAAIANLRTGGAGADVTVRSVAGDIALTWTQANPYNDGAFTGTLTLGAGGLFDQAVPFLDVARQKIVLQYRDAAVGAGVLSAPVAQRSLTLFRAKGAPADTTSTIDWVFSELGDQIYIGSRTVP
jgi:hypothetical protein